ncbi:hypothetical protein AURDEDRAFT_183547 [Auricularia subglabra TFB-10046 SS5]|nr:hypothetical protein AURDEDRAFT_183547 [Auricularia subglabra TFB-10046 SS5]
MDNVELVVSQRPVVARTCRLYKCSIGDRGDEEWIAKEYRSDLVARRAESYLHQVATGVTLAREFLPDFLEAIEKLKGSVAPAFQKLSVRAVETIALGIETTGGNDRRMFLCQPRVAGSRLAAGGTGTSGTHVISQLLHCFSHWYYEKLNEDYVLLEFEALVDGDCCLIFGCSEHADTQAKMPSCRFDEPEDQLDAIKFEFLDRKRPVQTWDCGTIGEFFMHHAYGEVGIENYGTYLRVTNVRKPTIDFKCSVQINLEAFNRPPEREVELYEPVETDDSNRRKRRATDDGDDGDYRSSSLLRPPPAKRPTRTQVKAYSATEWKLVLSEKDDQLRIALVQVGDAPFDVLLAPEPVAHGDMKSMYKLERDGLPYAARQFHTIGMHPVKSMRQNYEELKNELVRHEFARHIGDAFRKELDRNKTVYYDFRFSESTIYKVPGSQHGGVAWIVDPMLPSTDVVKFSGSVQAGIGHDLASCTMNALAHYSFEVTHGEYLITDIQGIYEEDFDGLNRLVLFDTLSNTLRGLTGVEDHGEFGAREFANEHVCSTLCFALELSCPSSYPWIKDLTNT